MARGPKDKQTSVTRRKDAKYPGESLLEISFPGGKGCLVSILVDDQGRPTIDIYRADPEILVLVPNVNNVVLNKTILTF